MVNIAALSSNLDIYLSCKNQLTSLLIDNIFTVVSSKDTDFVDIFSLKFASGISKHTKINNYLINLVDGEQLFYRPIYNLVTVELQILETYIETYPSNNFIQAFKLFSGAVILFIQKLDDNFQFSINYQELNNLTIKN